MKERILKKVFEHAECVSEKINDHNLILTALCGSQNYNLDNESSDVDTKTFMIPSFSWLILSNNRLSKTVHISGNEQSDAKDIRLVCFRLVNRGINYFETLYTPYVNINPKYEDFYATLLEMRDDIVHCNPHSTVQALGGATRQLLSKGLCGDKLDQKKMAQAYASYMRLVRYSTGFPFEEVLDGSEYRDEYFDIKSNITLKEAQLLSHCLLKETNRILEDFPSMPPAKKEKVEKQLNEIVYELFKREYQ